VSGCGRCGVWSHSGELASLNVCGGWGLVPFILRTIAMLAAWTAITGCAADAGVALKLCLRLAHRRLGC